MLLCMAVSCCLCCTPYIMDSLSSINTCQRSVRGSSPESIQTHVAQSCVIPLAYWTIVTARLDFQLISNPVHLYLVSVTWIYIFFYLPFCVPRVFLLPASRQSGRSMKVCASSWRHGTQHCHEMEFWPSLKNKCIISFSCSWLGTYNFQNQILKKRERK